MGGKKRILEWTAVPFSRRVMEGYKNEAGHGEPKIREYRAALS